MKFRNPKTGQVYDVTGPKSDCVASGFCELVECQDCPIRKNNKCYEWVLGNPDKAARLMGYEVVEYEKEETNMDKPRICEVLGVEVEEWFSYPGMNTSFQVTEGGFLKCADGDLMMCVPTLINHPDRIIRKPRWTEQEVERAKAIKVLYPEICYIKSNDGWLRGLNKGKESIFLDCVLSWFPSLRPGESVTLDEIIGGAE